MDCAVKVLYVEYYIVWSSAIKMIKKFKQKKLGFENYHWELDETGFNNAPAVAYAMSSVQAKKLYAHPPRYLVNKAEPLYHLKVFVEK